MEISMNDSILIIELKPFMRSFSFFNNVLKRQLLHMCQYVSVYGISESSIFGPPRNPFLLHFAVFFVLVGPS